MSVSDWNNYTKEIADVLSRLAICGRSGQTIPTSQGFEEWTAFALEVKRENRNVYLIGNGASASMASHFAADLAKNAQIPTQVFYDLSLITAISNDIGYYDVFAEPLRRRGRPGDLLIAISSSGKSENIIAAANVAINIEMTIVTLSAMDSENPLRSLGNLNLYVPAISYGLAETSHAAILHYWMDMVESKTKSV